ncbi:MAG: pantoate--beta-alanine ligase [Deltaproteobacteria bacterium]|nr:pantoate--beta-alanine ligase [Deltaproteobacteria bacterium]
MERITTVRALQQRADAERLAGRRIALVPTMGALHAGHLALVDEARRRAQFVVVSIFVNPAQFNSTTDLAAYPRPLEADLAACVARGVDAVFLPTADELYPTGYQTWVEVTELAKPLCGASRPGHFRGVATVVAKLLVAAKPHFAVFGAKDFQQLALIRRLTRDLGLDVEIVGHETVRERDGLAMSSRNVHLTSETRVQALALSRALGAAQRAIDAGERSRTALEARVASEIARSPLAKIDYAELRDPESLALAPERLTTDTLLALAVFFPKAGGDVVRLIDNAVLHVPKEN